MKNIIFILAIFTSFNLFSQTNVVADTTKQFVNQPMIAQGVDISKANPNEQGFILYMESLSDERALELLRSMVKGEIVYKKEN